MNLMHVFEYGDSVLITTFVILIFMSITSWYVIFWKALIIRTESQRLQNFKKLYIKSHDWPRHLNIHKIDGSISILLKEAEKTKPLLANTDERKRQQLLTVHLSQGLDVIRTWLDKGLTILASVGSSAPFIGLFGTVWGIYGALTDIAVKGSASLNVVAGPMGEALVATAVGLFAAIPAVLAYNAFVRKNRLLVQELRHISEQLTLFLYEDTKNDSRIKLAPGE